MSQASVFAGVYLYGSGSGRVEERVLWTGAIALSGAWLATFACFVGGIAVPKYRHTIWSLTSGRQYIQDIFLKGESDEAKFGIFRRNLLLWDGDIGDEVRAWVAKEWKKWQEETPAWFKVERVPDQFIPQAELGALGCNRERRGSAARSVRESVAQEVKTTTG
jgi:hypothetical protein